MSIKNLDNAVSWDDITDKPAELGGDIAFSDLTDGFALTGNANKVVGVNSAGNALEPKTISTGAETIQTKTASSESAGSVDLSLGHWLELNCDADFSFSIIDTTKMTAGYTYKVDCKNTKSPSGVVTGSIPTGWWSNVGSSLPLATGESAPAFLTKNSAGVINILFGIQQVV